MDLHGRSLLKEIDLTSQEFLFLVDLAGILRSGETRRPADDGWRAGTSR